MREHSANVSDSRLIRKRLYQLNQPRQFDGFELFLMKKILPEEKEKILEEDSISQETLLELKEEAYLLLYKRIKSEKVASRVTIKKWFGLDGCVRPKRKQIIKLAFALKLTEDELQEYLIQGILQPGIQINDYREMIYLYGLKAGISFEECADMITFFEAQVYKDTVLEQNTHTVQLWNMFRENCDKPKEDFLAWMCSNAGFFKGYSKVALRHFMELKSEILSYIRQNARENLFKFLKETNFEEWAQQNNISKNEYGENISRYIKNISRRKDKGNLTEELKDGILGMSWIVYSSHDKTTDLLAELYASAVEAESGSIQNRRIHYKHRKNFNLPDEIFFMTDKHVSQIIGIAQHKEKEIRLSQALGSLEDAEGECPEWIRKMLLEYGIEPPESAKKTRELLRKLLTMQEQRCHIVQREDLLPLIHYVAQKRYERTLQGQDSNYRYEDAKIFFIQMADTILEECKMATISEEYQLDYLLLSCYGKEYMYSLADVIEAAEKEE